MKACASCSSVKLPSEFGVNRARKDGLSVYCKPCARSISKEANARFRASHPDYHSTWMAARRSDPETRVKQQAMARQRYAENPEPLREKKREYMRVNRSKYVNPVTRNAAKARYRAALLNAIPRNVDHAAITAFYAEARKVSHETGIVHHVDHIVPLQGETVCGLHVPWNLQIIPAAMNQSKGNKLLAQTEL